ncbi:MAG: CBS domain-containing protein [Deltaproteobacteria bacterium]|nr:CBS domain-containing protein [Deltaproteobacteria bacterium]MBW2658056.1 CBS domain-containing protein [Deltaproteobacteria bacterium]
MAQINRKNTLRNLGVSEAMRRQVIQLDQVKSIDHGITVLIKYKINALLIVDSRGQSVGVVSKTDIMGAYYAGLPIESPLEHIMVTPPLFCYSGDSLEAALEQMRESGVYRLYVMDKGEGDIVGALAYPDIVGLLYQYCHQCEYSHLQGGTRSGQDDPVRRFTVREVMTASVKGIGLNETLNTVMETLSAYRFGAMLVTDAKGLPCGVISKTDLALSYRHGVDPEVEAGTVMSSPVSTCDVGLLLEEAIKKMTIADIHRLFVHKVNPDNIVGVLSLTDAARIRSGSCYACVSSRIKVNDHD